MSQLSKEVMIRKAEENFSHAPPDKCVMCTGMVRYTIAFVNQCECKPDFGCETIQGVMKGICDDCKTEYSGEFNLAPIGYEMQCELTKQAKEMFDKYVKEHTTIKRLHQRHHDN